MKNLIVIIVLALGILVSATAEAGNFKKSNALHNKARYKSQRKWMAHSCHLKQDKRYIGYRGAGVSFR
jgi:hypothetical protein